MIEQRKNSFKLKEGYIRRKEKIFSVRVLRHTNRLLSDVVDAASLETFKMRLDQALGDLM